MIDQKWEHATTEAVKISITSEMIASYAKAIHEDALIYYDKQVAIAAGFKNIPAPPTLPIIFWQFINVPWLKDAGAIIHGKQQFHYEQPLLANRTYDCSIHLKDITKKQSKKGMMQLSTHELMIKFEDQIHATAITTLIIFEE